MSFPLVCMGHPLLDISSPVPESLLQKYNVLPGSACLANESHMPLYNEMTTSFQCDFIGGGAALNTSRAAQWLSKTPNFTAFFGAIGQDDFAMHLREAASEAGVNTYFLIDPSHETGSCACLIHERERALVANLGASQYYKLTHLRENWSVLENSKVIYSEGYFLTDAADSVLEAAKYASSAGKVFSINLSAPYVIEFFKKEMDSVLPYTEYLFGNEEEFAKFGQVYGLGTDLTEIARAVARLEKHFERTRKVIVTRGKDSVLVINGEELTEFSVPRVEADKVLDTNGAGDSFCGGFLFELIRGSDLGKCVAAGNYVAGEVIQLSGCSFPEFSNYSY